MKRKKRVRRRVSYCKKCHYKLDPCLYGRNPKVKVCGQCLIVLGLQMNRTLEYCASVKLR